MMSPRRGAEPAINKKVLTPKFEASMSPGTASATHRNPVSEKEKHISFHLWSVVHSGQASCQNCMESLPERKASPLVVTGASAFPFVGNGGVSDSSPALRTLYLLLGCLIQPSNDCVWSYWILLCRVPLMSREACTFLEGNGGAVDLGGGVCVCVNCKEWRKGRLWSPCIVWENEKRKTVSSEARVSV